MIEKIAAYKSSDGKCVGSIEEVQRHELRILLTPGMIDGEKGTDQDRAALDTAVHVIVENRDKVVDVLTTGPRSKPKARSVNGGTKKRTPKPAQAVVAPIGENGPVQR